MRRGLALIVVAASAAAGLAACGDDVDVYKVAKSLPDGEHGDLIESTELDDVEGIDGRVFLVQYLSTSVPGDPIAVTGLIAVPKGDAPKGGWPLVSYAHGTAGMADVCAPSKHPDELARIIGPMVAKGWVVAASDYEGLGTPGRHPYMAGISEGRGVLDIATAARHLEGAHASDRVVLWGHSQGGHAVLFANEFAKQWAPDLDVVGTVAIAPVTETPLIAAALADTPARGYLPLAAYGLRAAYPDADPALVLGPKAIDKAGVLDTGCTDEILKTYLDMPPSDLLKADPNTVEPWKSVLAVNDPGHRMGVSPIDIVHGDADKTIPLLASQLLFARLCGMEQPAMRKVYPGAGHSDVTVTAFDDNASFTAARFAGEPFTTGCS